MTSYFYIQTPSGKKIQEDNGYHEPKCAASNVLGRYSDNPKDLRTLKVVWKSDLAYGSAGSTTKSLEPAAIRGWLRAKNHQSQEGRGTQIPRIQHLLLHLSPRRCAKRCVMGPESQDWRRKALERRGNLYSGPLEGPLVLADCQPNGQVNRLLR